MSQNNLELARNGDRVWLNYWDSEHGEDEVYELIEGAFGTGQKSSGEKVDLVAALRALAMQIRD